MDVVVVDGAVHLQHEADSILLRVESLQISIAAPDLTCNAVSRNCRVAR